MRSKRATLSSPVTHNKHRRSLSRSLRQERGPSSLRDALLLRLHLHGLAQLRRCARNDNEIPLRRCARALRNLTDGADGVDDGGAGRIRHEPSERFQMPRAFGSSESASTNGCLGASPVTAACSTCTRPWSNSVTCVAGLESLPTNESCTRSAATPRGCKFCVPSPCGTAFGT